MCEDSACLIMCTLDGFGKGFSMFLWLHADARASRSCKAMHDAHLMDS